MDVIREIRVESQNTSSCCLPSDWSLVPLSVVVAESKPIVYGIVQAGPHIENGQPYIKTADLTNFKVSNLQRTSNEVASKYKRSVCKPNDIVIGLRGDLPTTIIVPNDLKECNLTQGTARISVKKEIDYRFINYALYSRLAVKKINVLSKGSTFKEISLSDLRQVLLAVPNFSKEQQKIAEILSTWDEAITNTEKLIKQLKKRKKGLMQSLLTGKKRLKGFSGEWKEFAYSHLLREVNRPVIWNDDKLYKLISVRRRSGGLFKRESLYGRDILTKNLKTAVKGDFLISKMQILHGASGLVNSEFDGMKVSGSYLVLRAKNEEVLDMEYFNWLAKMPYFYHQTYVASSVVHIEKMTFNYKAFLKLKTSLPEINEQRAVVGILNGTLNEIKAQKHYLDELTNQKKGLMQQLLTGQKRVKL